MFSNISTPRTSKKPSAYPPLPFHLLRLAQFVSSLIDASVLIFFTHHLQVGHFSIPWTFLLLLTVSLLTILSLLLTTLHALPPRRNLLANTALSALWILALALLTWNLSWTLGHRCVPATWDNEAGIMVCRLYKALIAFTVMGLFSTFLAAMLDWRTYRESMHRGMYNQMGDIKAPTEARAREPFQPLGDGDGADVARPYRAQTAIEAERFGYTQPSEQTSYAGGGGLEGCRDS